MSEDAALAPASDSSDGPPPGWVGWASPLPGCGFSRVNAGVSRNLPCHTVLWGGPWGQAGSPVQSLVAPWERPGLRSWECTQVPASRGCGEKAPVLNVSAPGSRRGFRGWAPSGVAGIRRALVACPRIREAVL